MEKVGMYHYILFLIFHRLSKMPMFRGAVLFIRMHASKQIVYSEICHQNGEKGN